MTFEERHNDFLNAKIAYKFTEYEPTKRFLLEYKRFANKTFDVDFIARECVKITQRGESISMNVGCGLIIASRSKPYVVYSENTYEVSLL